MPLIEQRQRYLSRPVSGWPSTFKCLGSISSWVTPPHTLATPHHALRANRESELPLGRFREIACVATTPPPSSGGRSLVVSVSADVEAQEAGGVVVEDGSTLLVPQSRVRTVLWLMGRETQVNLTRTSAEMEICLRPAS